MSTATNDVKVIVTADVSGVRPGIDAVNGQLRGMAERAEGVMGETRKMFSGIEAGAMRAKEQVKGLAQTFSVSGGAVDANTGIFSKHAYAIQNASYQLTDFFVQVQNGTRVSVALGQQLPQLLAGFGALGAVAGLVASLAPTVVQAFMDSEGASKSLADAMSDLDNATSSFSSTAKKFNLSGVIDEFNKSGAAARKATVDVKEFEFALQQKRLNELRKGIQDETNPLGDFTGVFSTGASDKMNALFDVRKLQADSAAYSDFLRLQRQVVDGTLDLSKAFVDYRKLFSSAAATKDGEKLGLSLKAYADGLSDVAAAENTLNEMRQKIAGGVVSGGSNKKDLARRDAAPGRVTDPFLALNERALNRVDAAQTRAADAMTGFETKNLDRVSALRLEIELLGKSADEVAEAKALAEIDRQFEASRLQVEKYLGAIGDTDGIDRLTGELSRAAQVAKGEMLSAFSEMKAKQDALNASWEVGADRALKRYSDQAKNVAAASEQAFTRAFSGMEDALVEFAMTGKLNFSNLATSIISDLIRIQIRASMTQVLGGASGGGGLVGLIGNFLGIGGGSAGNYITNDWSTNNAPATDWGGYTAPSWDGGGYTGNGPRSGGLDGKGGFWAIMHPKETVIDHTKAQPASIGGGSVSIEIHNYGSQQATTRESTDSRGNRKVEVIIGEMVAGEQSRPGSSLYNAQRSTFGLRPALVGR